MSSRILRLLKPDANQTKWLLILVFGTLGILAYLGYYEQIKTVLNQPAYTVKIGTTKLSPYIFLKGLFTIVISFWIAGITHDFTAHQIHSVRGIKPATRTLLAKIFQILIYLICGVVMLRVLGIDLTALAVFSGAVGIGLGFGLQKITSNFISGLILLFEKTIRVDDLVELVDGVQGFVRYMGARHTLLETADGKEIMIPNEDFITHRLTNLTYNNKKAQIEIRVVVSYESDLQLAQKLMLEAAQNHPRCIKDPIPQCFLHEFADSGAVFRLQFWIGDVTEGRSCPKSEVMFSLWNSLKSHGIQMGYPQRAVWVRQEKESGV